MTSMFHFFDHWAEYEDSFSDLTSTPRSWVVNGYGRCEFSVPYDHPAAKERFIRFGNIVHIVHKIEPGSSDGRLPDWTGIILPPRTWNKDSIQVVAYSLEGIFAYRAMPFIDRMTGTATSVFIGIIELAQDVNRFANGDLPFRFGSGQFDNGPDAVYSDDLRTNAYDHIKKITDTAAMEWSADATFDATRAILSFTISFTNRKTGWSGGTLDPTNTEESDPLLIEQGMPFNRIFAYSQAQTAADRVFLDIPNQPSIDLYGEYQINQTYLGVHDAAGLAAAAGTASDLKGYPQRVFKRIVTNTGGIFNYLKKGNLLQVNDNRVGFNASGTLGFRDMVRIVAMDYNDTTDKVNLTVEIVPPVMNKKLLNNPIDGTQILYTGA